MGKRVHKIDAANKSGIIKVDNELKQASNISSSFTFTVSKHGRPDAR